MPGFEGLPQYEGFYARSNTDITGGFDGIKKIVSDSDRREAESELRKEIEDKLSESSKENIGTGLLAFSDPSMQMYEVTDKSSSGNEVIIGMKGTANVIILEASQLSNAIASASIGSFDIDNEAVLIKNIDDIDVSVSTNDSKTSPESVSILASGQATFVWQTNLDSLAKALAGTEIKQIKNVLKNFSSISNVDISKKVFWKRNFSENPEDINLIIEESK